MVLLQVTSRDMSCSTSFSAYLAADSSCAHSFTCFLISFAVPVWTYRAHPPLSRHNWHSGPWIPIVQKFGPSPATASRRMDEGVEGGGGGGDRSTGTVSGRRMDGPFSTPFTKQFEFIQSNVKHHFHPGTLSG